MGLIILVSEPLAADFSINFHKQAAPIHTTTGQMLLTSPVMRCAQSHPTLDFSNLGRRILNLGSASSAPTEKPMQLTGRPSVAIARSCSPLPIGRPFSFSFSSNKWHKSLALISPLSASASPTADWHSINGLIDGRR